MIPSSIESDMMCSSHHSLDSSSSRFLIDEEPLPALVPDERIGIQSPSHVIHEARRDFLDQKHLLNLERCLIMLPLPDRIKFIQDVMKFQHHKLQQQQGVRMVVVARNDCNLSSRATQMSSSHRQNLAENGYDIALLSDFESLLHRVGLGIQFCNPTRNQFNCSKSVKKVCTRRGSINSDNKKHNETSFVKIEA